MNKILKFIEQSYYTELIVLFCVLFAFIIIINPPANNLKKIFIWYVTLSLVYELLGFVSAALIESQVRNVTNRIINFAFAALEHLIIGLFFISLFKDGRFQKIVQVNITILTLASVTFIFVALSNSDMAKKLEDLIFSVELSILTCYCLFFYYSVFQSKETFNLKTFGPFWIVTGLFFYCLVSIPFFIVASDIYQLNQKMYSFLFAVHYTFFSIFFLTISKGVLCKQTSLKL